MKLVIQADNGTELLTYEYEDIRKFIVDKLGEEVGKELDEVARQLKEKTMQI